MFSYIFWFAYHFHCFFLESNCAFLESSFSKVVAYHISILENSPITAPGFDDTSMHWKISKKKTKKNNKLFNSVVQYTPYPQNVVIALVSSSRNASTKQLYLEDFPPRAANAPMSRFPTAPAAPMTSTDMFRTGAAVGLSPGGAQRFRGYLQLMFLLKMFFV